MTTSQLSEFKKLLNSSSEFKHHIPDKQTRKLLFYLFTNTRGGLTRLQIILILLQRSCNTHQLSRELQLDYKAVQHHMRVLEKNNVVTKIGGKYGAVFHLSNLMEINIYSLNDVIDILDRKMNHKKVYL